MTSTDFDRYMKIIRSSTDLDDGQLIEVANALIRIIIEKPHTSENLISHIYELYDNEIEMIRIRALEIALKLLDYSLYGDNKLYSRKILKFLEDKLPNSTEKIRTTLIIHYSWAHRKFPNSAEIIAIYDKLIANFNKNKEFRRVFDEVNHMERTPSYVSDH